MHDIRDDVREAYGKIGAADSMESGCCSTGCGSLDSTVPSASETATKLGYTDEDVNAAPQGSNLGLGCGNPQAIAALAPGEVEHKYYCTVGSSGAGLMAIDELSGGKTVRVELIGNSLPAGTFAPAGACP